MAGLLTHDFQYSLPVVTVCGCTFAGANSFTAAGTVAGFHGIPFSSSDRGTIDSSNVRKTLTQITIWIQCIDNPPVMWRFQPVGGLPETEYLPYRRTHYFRSVDLLNGIKDGNIRALARAITLVENELPGYEELLRSLVFHPTPVIGITGPPGAGKSTLINALLKQLSESTNGNGLPNKIAVLAVDPTSPFSHGSLLGDRLRMHDHFNSPNVFIRSLATRGALGGLSAKTIEIADVLRGAEFDYIFIETVGVGQSEVEIIALADTVIVTLVPEAGDEIQALKSGIMEIGDVFVVNKSDRDGADKFAAGLIRTLHERPMSDTDWVIPVIKTVASRQEGIAELITAIQQHTKLPAPQQRISLLAERAFRLIQHERMKGISVAEIQEKLSPLALTPDFNLYRFIDRWK